MLRWGAPSFSCGAELFPINGEGVLFVFFLTFFLVPPNLMLLDGEGVLIFFKTFFWSPLTSRCSTGKEFCFF